MLKIKEEYNKRCEEIYYMILAAYMDKCLLIHIEEQTKTIENNGNMILQHMVNLLISDLVLNVCKICHDKKGGKEKRLQLKDWKNA